MFFYLRYLLGCAFVAAVLIFVPAFIDNTAQDLNNISSSFSDITKLTKGVKF